MKKIIVLLLICSPIFGYGQDSIFGKWTTIDDSTGDPKSVVEIFEKEGKVYGRVVELLKPSTPFPKCDLCTDDRKGQPVMGMEIIRALVEEDGEWGEGTIMDPENGKVYDCKIWLEDGKLMVRGYIAFFFRTQEWVRS